MMWSRVLKVLNRKSRNNFEGVLLHTYIVSTHIYVYMYINVCVYICFSHSENTGWNKAQRTLESLTTWQPLADCSWDVILITVEK